MDILSHGLYGGVLVGRKSRRSFWLAFFFGIAPDLFSFGIFTASVWLGLASGLDWGSRHPDPSLIPSYVQSLYNVTHSLVIWTLVFALVWIVYRKLPWVLGAWGLHILCDIPTHSTRFFPTPFLWPFNTPYVNGIPWARPTFMIANYALLALTYLGIHRYKVIKSRR